MSIADLMQQHQQHQARGSDGGRQTRLGRFGRLFETAFGTHPDAFDMRLEDRGAGQGVEGHISYNGRNYVLTYGTGEGVQGKWWFLNGEPLFKHQGRMSNTQGNMGRILGMLGGNQPPQTTRLEAE